MQTEDQAVANFVHAADHLVNLLAGSVSFGRLAARRAYEKQVDAAYDAYDLARYALTGERIEDLDEG